MSLLNVLDLAASAMNAQSVRMNLAASNMANADSVSSSIGTTYKARHPVFQTVYQDYLASDAGPGQRDVTGVRLAGVIESQAAPNQQYAPNHPAANADGFIYTPAISTVEEMANLVSASRSYQANIEVTNTAKAMLMRTLTLGQR